MENRLNEELKNITTYQELIEWRKELSSGNLGGYFSLEMKKTGKSIAEIFQHPYNEERVEYIINDGYSVGNSKISNLNRNIKVVRNGDIY